MADIDWLTRDIQRLHPGHPKPLIPRWRFRRLFRPFKMRRFVKALERIDGMVIDTETGGLNPDKDALLAVGYIGVVNGLPVTDAFGEYWVTVPQGRVTDRAAEVNGWDGKRRYNSIAESAMLAKLRAAVERTYVTARFATTKAKLLPIAHGWVFDHSFLMAAERRYLTGAFRSYRLLNAQQIRGHAYDTSSANQLLNLAGRSGVYSLDDLCKQHRIDGFLKRDETGHVSPLADCAATYCVMLEQLWSLC